MENLVIPLKNKIPNFNTACLIKYENTVYWHSEQHFLNIFYFNISRPYYYVIILELKDRDFHSNVELLKFLAAKGKKKKS